MGVQSLKFMFRPQSSENERKIQKKKFIQQLLDHPTYHDLYLKFADLQIMFIVDIHPL